MKNEIKCEFEFHPVGQGLFYSAHLESEDDDYTFVYDCGSEMRIPRTNAISDFRKRFLKNKKEIDLLIISHLHTDHFNGVKQLLQDRGAKLAILPYMEDWERLLIRQTSGQTSKWLDDFLTDPSGYLISNGVRNIVYIDNSSLEAEETPFDPDAFYSGTANEYLRSFTDFGRKIEPKISDKGIHVIKDSGWSFRVANEKWFFVFYNNPLSSEIRKCFQQILLDAGINLYNTQSVTDLLSNTKDNRISAAYKKVFGKGMQLNTTSLITIHGPCGNPRLKNRNGHIEYPTNKHCQLLTGDFSFPLWLGHFCNANRKLLNRVGIATIPHHGSSLNWTNEVLEKIVSPMNWIASYGKNNRYGHPSKFVKNSLKIKNKKLVSVTENCRRKYHMHLEYLEPENPLFSN